MATIHQKFTGDAGQLEKEIEKLRAQQIKMEEQLAKTGKAGVEANRALQEQVRAGIALSKQLGSETETLGDKHRRMKAELKAAWMTGKIESKAYADGLLQLDKRLQVSLDQIKKQKLAVQEKTGATELLATKIGGVAAGWVSVTALISGATNAVREHNAEVDKGKGETEKLRLARKNLLQVSQGDMNELEKRADTAAVKFGVDRATAREVLFNARSEGFEGDYERIVQLDPVMDPKVAGRIAGQVRKLFDKEQLTAIGAVNAVLQGANYSRLSVEGIASALPQAGEGGRQQGATLDETVAGIAVLSSVFKSGETTGDRLKMLMSKMAIDKRTSGKGLLGGLDIIQGMSDKDREKFLGDSQELRAAYTAATDKEDEIRQQTGAVRDARSRSSGTDKLLQEFYGNKILLADTARRGGEIARDISAEKAYSESANSWQSFQDFVNKRMTDRGAWGINRFLVNRAMDAAWLTSSNGTPQSSSIINSGLGKQWESQQAAFLERQTQLLESVEANTKAAAENTRKAAQIPAGANRNVGEERD